MKLIRKVTCVAAVMFFLAAVIIGLGVIFAVKNVNIKYVTYSANAENLEKLKTETSYDFSKFKGKSILFVSEDDCLKLVDGGDFNLVSCEKKFPCTLNLVLEERVASYAVKSEDGYSLYDRDGRFYKSQSTYGEDVILLNGVDGAEQVKEIAGICGIFAQKFNSSKNLVGEITAVEDRDFATLTFTLCSGFEIRLVKYHNLVEEKIQAAFDKFNSLDDKEKVVGGIRCQELEGGVVEALYVK